MIDRACNPLLKVSEAVKVSREAQDSCGEALYSKEVIACKQYLTDAHFTFLSDLLAFLNIHVCRGSSMTRSTSVPGKEISSSGAPGFLGRCLEI